MAQIPGFLKNIPLNDGETLRDAHTRWFRDARYGLFMHYGLYSLYENHEWVQYKEKIPVAEYAKQMENFTAAQFDPDSICRLALACGMKYITLTTRHHDSFCLFKTNETEFQSLNSPARRDLVGELADACETHGLAFYLYYSHGRDWKHPHAPNNDKWGGHPRPEYAPPEPSYAYGDAHDLNNYIEFMHKQLVELLTQYPTAAGIWLDGIMVPLTGPTEEFRIPETYDLIRRTNPHALLSYKQGVTGTEDFFAPEFHIPDNSSDATHQGQITKNKDKPIEICATMNKGSWGYSKTGEHRTEDEVWEALTKAGTAGANLLLNSGPLPSGAFDPLDSPVLRAVGERLRTEGFPG